MVQIAFRFQFKDVIITKALGFEKCSNGEPQCQDLKVEKKEPQQIQKACVGLASSAYRPGNWIVPTCSSFLVFF